MKIIKNSFILLLLFTTLCNCSSNKKFKQNYQRCKNNRIKCDTIYYYFKNVKNEEKKVYLVDTLNNRFQTEYRMRFKKSNKYFFASTKTHHKGWDTLGKTKIVLYKTKVIEKDKSFLRKNKNKIYTYDDFKNKTTYEMNRFYSSNLFNTKYLIDKSENKNGKIYLKRIGLGGNFPRVQ